jgi:hypothetical protein
VSGWKCGGKGEGGGWHALFYFGETFVGLMTWKGLGGWNAYTCCILFVSGGKGGGGGGQGLALFKTVSKDVNEKILREEVHKLGRQFYPGVCGGEVIKAARNLLHTHLWDGECPPRAHKEGGEGALLRRTQSKLSA